MAKRYPVSLLCKIAHVSKSGYYKWLRCQEHLTPKQKEEQQIKSLIMDGYQKSKGIYGYPRIKAWLRQSHGIQINHKRVYRLMKEMGIQSRIRRKRKFFGRREQVVVSDNKLNRDFTASHPREKWATDITFVIFNGRRLYLSVIYDLFNNEVIAYKISKRNDLTLVMDTVKAALKINEANGVILHSDQGYQYTSRKYNEFLKASNITISMSRKGNCLDNACIESFFSHLKTECLYLNVFTKEDEVRKAIQRYIHFYNYERIQVRLNNLSPVLYRAQIA